ncbi:MAG: hypothetical protein KDA22_12260, partial [Phycisphaerales bacterium]|nr:hypothetical protein [Phycisphaerales bacterium]
MIDLVCHTAPPHAVPVAALLRRSGLPGPLAALVEASVLRDPEPDPGLDAIAEGTLEPARLISMDLRAVPAGHL